MQTTPRPLPRIPPPKLSFVHPTDVRSYRPLPTPPLLSAEHSRTSSTESVYLQATSTYATSLTSASPPPHATRDSSSSLSSFTSFSSASSALLPKPRPMLRISVTSPALRDRNSLDSLTVRSPTLCDPGQKLFPVADRRQSRTKRSPHITKRPSRVSAVNSASLPVFTGPRITIETSIYESEEGEPDPAFHIPQSGCGIPDRIPTPQPPRSRPPPILTDKIGIDYPTTAIRVVTDAISDSDSDDEIEGLNPHTVSSTDLTDGHESRASKRRVWTSFPNIAKVAIKSHLFCPKTRSTNSGDAPAANAKRISQMASPLDQTWYKEQDGWRWVERDVDEVLAELRRLR